MSVVPNMNKARLEALSDGVFAVVMTLLVFDVKLPTYTEVLTNSALWSEIFDLWPLITSFVLSFLVLAVFWINHNVFFSRYVKEVDRKLNFLHMIYLLFLVFVPFSAHIFGAYPYMQPAALIYGLNILAIMLLMFAMLVHIQKNPELAAEVEVGFSRQAAFRTKLTIYSYIIGILFSFFFTPASAFFYLFPIIFNFFPGSIAITERIFSLHSK